MIEEMVNDRLADILSKLRMDASGLPNLPALADNWDVSEYQVALDPTRFVNVAQSNPSRWLLSLCLNDGGTFVWTTLPDELLTAGSVQPNATKTFKYKDFGLFLANDFFVLSKSASQTLTVVNVNLRLKGNQ